MAELIESEPDAALMEKIVTELIALYSYTVEDSFRDVAADNATHYQIKMHYMNMLKDISSLMEQIVALAGEKEEYRALFSVSRADQIIELLFDKTGEGALNESLLWHDNTACDDIVRPYLLDILGYCVRFNPAVCAKKNYFEKVKSHMFWENGYPNKDITRTAINIVEMFINADQEQFLTKTTINALIRMLYHTDDIKEQTLDVLERIDALDGSGDVIDDDFIFEIKKSQDNELALPKTKKKTIANVLSFSLIMIPFFLIGRVQDAFAGGFEDDLLVSVYSFGITAVGLISFFIGKYIRKIVRSYWYDDVKLMDMIEDGFRDLENNYHLKEDYRDPFIKIYGIVRGKRKLNQHVLDKLNAILEKAEAPAREKALHLIGIFMRKDTRFITENNVQYLIRCLKESEYKWESLPILFPLLTYCIEKK